MFFVAQLPQGVGRLRWKDGWAAQNSRPLSTLSNGIIDQPRGRDGRWSEYWFTSHNYEYIATVETSCFSASYHKQHCTLQAFKQFGALYMHSRNGTAGMRTQYLLVSSHN